MTATAAYVHVKEICTQQFENQYFTTADNVIPMTYTAVSICIGKQEDCEQVTSLVNEAFKTAYIFRTEDYLTIVEYLSSLKLPHETWYLLKTFSGSSEKIVSVVKHVLINKDVCELKIFATDVKERGKKYGETLIRAVEALTTCNVINISCVDTPKLVNYYKALGFTPTGETFYFDNKYLKPEYHNKVLCCKLSKKLTKK
jgi:hypothetical protein